MSLQRDNLLIRLTNVIYTATSSVWYQLIQGVGEALDTVDPNQINLSEQFSVTTATGNALDRNGADWGVTRRTGEDDDAYRNRILATLPQYLNGPTVGNIKSIVRAFTGEDPEIFEYGPDSFTMGASVMGTFGFAPPEDTFNFLITIRESKKPYNRQDLIDAVNAAKPARSSVDFNIIAEDWINFNNTWSSYSDKQLNEL